MARIGIFGAGYVGLVTGACFADLGHDVVLRDIKAETIDDLEAGRVPIHEPDLGEVLARNREAGRISFTLDIDEVVRGAEFLYVAVGTPQSKSGEADLSAVWSVVEDLPRALDGRPILVMKSTVPAGTGVKVRALLDDKGLANVGYVSNPEFLAEGDAVKDFNNPDRVVVGAFEPEDGKRVLQLHAKFAGTAPFLEMDVTSAELVKLAANAMLATRISFINEIASVCEVVGGDVERVAEGIGLDRRIGPKFLHAGIGYGGSCFPKDVEALKYLAGEAGYEFRILSSVIDVNHQQKEQVVLSKLESRLGDLRGRTIALIGLAFKPNTDDMREAPSEVIAAGLIEKGATVRGWDEVARPKLSGVEQCDTILDTVQGADAAVLVTEWKNLKRDLATPEVRDAMARPLIIDGRNFLDPADVAAAGFEYEAIGRPTKANPVAVS